MEVQGCQDAVRFLVFQGYCYAGRFYGLQGYERARRGFVRISLGKTRVTNNFIEDKMHVMEGEFLTCFLLLLFLIPSHFFSEKQSNKHQ